jgi:hypothetical protein
MILGDIPLAEIPLADVEEPVISPPPNVLLLRRLWLYLYRRRRT